VRMEWVQKRDRPRAILFCNGWGMDGEVLKHTPLPVEWDLAMLYDYTTLELPIEVPRLFDAYPGVVVVAWSMGVWGSGVLVPFAGRIRRTVAINGTGMPIDESFGIPPGPFHSTTIVFTEENQRAFYRRMCGSSEEYRRFAEAAPRRAPRDQQAELFSLESAINTRKWTGLSFDAAWIGNRDRIFPPRNQRRYWEGRTDCRSVDMPHFPFFDLGWEDLVACV